jgi:hypothetical protein
MRGARRLTGGLACRCRSAYSYRQTGEVAEWLKAAVC